MAEQSFKEALGDGLWVSIVDGKVGSPMVNGSVQYKDQSFFHQLEKEGVPLELHPNKVTTLFNYARLLEELHDSVRASLFYRLIIFKVLLLLSLLNVHAVERSRDHHREHVVAAFHFHGIQSPLPRRPGQLGIDDRIQFIDVAAQAVGVVQISRHFQRGQGPKGIGDVLI